MGDEPRKELKMVDTDCIICYNLAYPPITCSQCGKFVCAACFSQLPMGKVCPQRCHDDKRVWRTNNDVLSWIEKHESERVAKLTATPQFWFAMMKTFHPFQRFDYNELFLNDKRASSILRKVYEFTCRKQSEENLPAFLKGNTGIDVWCVEAPIAKVKTPFSCFVLGKFTFAVPFVRFVVDPSQKIVIAK